MIYESLFQEFPDTRQLFLYTSHGTSFGTEDVEGRALQQGQHAGMTDSREATPDLGVLWYKYCALHFMDHISRLAATQTSEPHQNVQVGE